MKMEDFRANLTRRDLFRVMAGGVMSLCATRCALFPGGSVDDRTLSFGVVADAQYCDQDPKGSRHYRASIEKLAASVEDFNRHELAFVIHLGDFIDARFESFDRLLPIYDALEMPHYHVLGNHDFDVAEERKDAVPSKLGMPGRYYDFGVGGFRFIALDGNDVSLYANRPGSARHEAAKTQLEELSGRRAPNAQPWNGALGAEQLAWLGRTLDAARAAREKVILFCHFPVYPEDVHNLWNDREVIELIEASGQVVAYINGHNHHGNYGVKEGIHYVTVQGMVETPARTAYATVLSECGRLTVDGRDREPNRALHYPKNS